MPQALVRMGGRATTETTGTSVNVPPATPATTASRLWVSCCCIYSYEIANLLCCVFFSGSQNAMLISRSKNPQCTNCRKFG